MNDRYPKLTPLRTFNLLERLNDNSISADCRIREAREALSNHVRASLVAGKRRRPAAKVRHLRSVG